MPQRGRSRRAAARQTQMSQRKKRHDKGPTGIPTPVTGPQVAAQEDGSEPHSERHLDTASSQPAAAHRPSLTRHAERRPTVYNYIGSELKRIIGISAGMVAILIAITFVLR